MKQTLIITVLFSFWLSPIFGQRFSVQNCFDDPIKTVTINEISDDGYRWEVNGKVIQEGKKNTLEVTPDIIGKTITVHWLCECGSWKKDTFKVIPKEEDVDIPTRVFPVSCNNMNDGKVVLEGDDKYGFSYEWNDGGNGATRYDLKAGKYEITATDSDGCKKTIKVEVVEPKPVVVKQVATNRPKCKGTASGAVSIDVDNPEKYSFEWEDGSTSPSREDLPAGDHFVKINDGDKCSVRKVTILEAEPPTAVPTVLTDYNGYPVSCDKAKDGKVQLNFVGGEPPYEVTWNKRQHHVWKKGDELPTFDHLPKGEFPVKITDANGCVNEQIVTLEAPKPIHLELVPSKYGEKYHLRCSGDNSGEIHAMTANGVGKLTYEWLHADTILSTSDKLFKVGRGSYAVKVTDENGCIAKDRISMKQPPKISAPISRKGDKRIVEVRGGSGDPTISIMTDDATDNDLLYGLESRTITDRKTIRTAPKTNYLIRVRDDNGCVTERTFMTHGELKHKRVPDDKAISASLIDSKSKGKKGCSRCYVFGTKRTGFKLY
ncbi:MAG: hypothetical protein AB8G11_24995 [Saprospiraceae bacterium]